MVLTFAARSLKAVAPPWATGLATTVAVGFGLVRLLQTTTFERAALWRSANTTFHSARGRLADVVGSRRTKRAVQLLIGSALLLVPLAVHRISEMSVLSANVAWQMSHRLPQLLLGVLGRWAIGAALVAALLFVVAVLGKMEAKRAG